MIRLTLIAALLLLSSSVADAQRLYAIAFADTSDYAIGQTIKWDEQSFLHLSEEVASDLRYERETIVKDGNACSKSELRKTVKQLSCSSNDIIMFAYFGHGVRSAGDKSLFPQMTLNSKKEKDFVPLEDVKNALLTKGARFLFVMGDCGNAVNQGVTPKKDVLKVKNMKTVISGKTGNTDAHNLFRAKGSVIVSASSAGENAWGTINGSVFSASLFNNLKDGRTELTWSELLSKVKEDVSNAIDILMQQAKEQTPIYILDIH